MKKIYVGIDISKEWIDVAVTADGISLSHQQFVNGRKGFLAMVQWVNKIEKDRGNWLICMEHTGIYAQPLWHYLSERSIKYCVVPGAVINNGLGIKRGKTDKIDAGVIACFARRYADQLKPFQLPTAVILRLKMLFAYRDRLVKAKVIIGVPAKEAKEFASKESKEMRADSSSLVQVLQARIAKVEKLMMKTINSDQQATECYKLITSVPGVGLVTGVYLLVITGCFTLITNSRKLANFCGVAPHPHESGKTVKEKKRVSHVADKRLKTLLSNGTGSLLQHNDIIKAYYARMLAKGKNENLVKNNIKNKTLHTVCAVVRRGTPYTKQYTPMLQKNAA